MRFLADENFDNDVVRGVLKRKPDADLVRVQDVGLMGAPDPDVLAWAAQKDRVLLTHDVKTMSRHAYDRVVAELPMPGVFEIARSLPIGLVIEEILVLIECSLPGEWEGQVRYLPLR